MRKHTFSILAALILAVSLTGCSSGSSTSEQSLNIACTTWPVYCFTTEITSGVSDITVTPVITSATSCIHDYTLTVENMKAIDRADVLIINGAGLEQNMQDAIDESNAVIIDSSVGIDLLASSEDPDEPDPHIWMDPNRAIQMCSNICDRMCQQDPSHADQYRENLSVCTEKLQDCDKYGKDKLENLSCRYMINFHDGFSYFADAYDLTILDAMEVEAGSEPSAKDIVRIAQEIEEYQIPAVFIEENGSDATAQILAGETGCQIKALSLIMSSENKEETGIDGYISKMENNFDTVAEVMK